MFPNVSPKQVGASNLWFSQTSRCLRTNASGDFVQPQEKTNEPTQPNFFQFACACRRKWLVGVRKTSELRISAILQVKMSSSSSRIPLEWLFAFLPDSLGGPHQCLTNVSKTLAGSSAKDLRHNAIKWNPADVCVQDHTRVESRLYHWAIPCRLCKEIRELQKMPFHDTHSHNFVAPGHCNWKLRKYETDIGNIHVCYVPMCCSKRPHNLLFHSHSHRTHNHTQQGKHIARKNCEVALRSLHNRRAQDWVFEVRTYDLLGRSLQWRVVVPMLDNSQWHKSAWRCANMISTFMMFGECSRSQHMHILNRRLGRKGFKSHISYSHATMGTHREP